ARNASATGPYPSATSPPSRSGGTSTFNTMSPPCRDVDRNLHRRDRRQLCRHRLALLREQEESIALPLRAVWVPISTVKAISILECAPSILQRAYAKWRPGWVLVPDERG